MPIYCVMKQEFRYDLSHVVYISTKKEKAEEYALNNNYLDSFGEPLVVEIVVELDI